MLAAEWRAFHWCGIFPDSRPSHRSRAERTGQGFFEKEIETFPPSSSTRGGVAAKSSHRVMWEHGGSAPNRVT